MKINLVYVHQSLVTIGQSAINNCLKMVLAKKNSTVTKTILMQ